MLENTEKFNNEVINVISRYCDVTKECTTDISRLSHCVIAQFIESIKFKLCKLLENGTKSITTLEVVDLYIEILRGIILDLNELKNHKERTIQ